MPRTAAAIGHRRKIAGTIAHMCSVAGSKQLMRRAICAVTRRYPLLRGNGWLAQRRALAALTPGPEIVTARLRDGSHIDVHANDMIGRTVLYTGDFDRAITAILRRVLRPGDVCWDIGANYGVYALTAARLVGPNGAVHAVEPQPQLAEMLHRSAARNGYQHLSVHAVALSDVDATARMAPPADNLGGAGLLSPDARHSRTIEVVTRQAAAYMSGAEPRAPRLVKIDVEGHEDVVVSAAHAYLAHTEPSVIAFESHPRRGIAFDDRPAVRMLRSLGYELFAIHRGWLRPTLQPQPPGKSTPRTIDFLALHAPSVEPTLRRRLGLATG